MNKEEFLNDNYREISKKSERKSYRFHREYHKFHTSWPENKICSAV
jgi:hypothetical protein